MTIFGTMPINGLSKMVYPIWVRAILFLLSCYLYIYDLLAFLPFVIFANPTRKLKKSARLKAKPLDPDDPGSPYRNIDYFDKLITYRFEGCYTLDRLWDRAIILHTNDPCMGTREIISVDEEVQPNGRVFEKLNMGAYKWQTFGEVANRVGNVACGLTAMGHAHGHNLVIYAETRAEWMITAIGCFKYGFPVVTVYSTLGEDAILQVVNETQAKSIVVTQENIPKVLAVLPNCPSLKRVIYMESRIPGTKPFDLSNQKMYPNDIPEDFAIVSFSELEERGSKSYVTPFEKPTPDDVAVIMYTSGTTGTPKGVIMTHGNMVAASAGQSDKIPKLAFGDIYIGYLPLAHVLELGAEFSSLYHGVCIGYSTPLTLTDTSSKIKRGGKGDCSVLRPTLMATVPTVMDRIYKAVVEKVERSSPMQKALFEFVYELKRSKIEDGYDTPFLNRLVFSRIRKILGGRVRMILSGGAPLNAETQRFMNICFCCPVGQGYGLTETCGAGTICDTTDLSTGRVGTPLACCDVRLRDWGEAGYLVTNKPRPQGEILIGGANVASRGYLNNPKQTEEDFITMDDKAWFCTGDIGEFHEDGCLSIIDRKKDLVKLQHGEYISLARVESALLTSPLVDNICVYGSPFHWYLIALIVPNRNNVTAIADKLKVDSSSFEQVCENKAVIDAVRKELEAHGKRNKLEKAEIPAKIHLCHEVWTAAMGLLTEALKLKRKPIEGYYRPVIDSLYHEHQ